MTLEKFTLTGQNEDETVKITVEGNSTIPYWYHDLKFEAIKHLLETIDIKHYDNPDDFFNSLNDIKKLLERLQRGE